MEKASPNSERKRLAKKTRLYRKLHRWVAIPLCLFMLLLGATGILLAWKKELGLLPKSQKSAELNNDFKPLSLDLLAKKSVYFADSLKINSEISRMDYRPNKGMVKVRFENTFKEIQLDIFTGKVLQIKDRDADWIEMIHDGSIVDYFFPNDNDKFKLLYSTITSLSLIFLSISGFFIWIYPKKMRRVN